MDQDFKRRQFPIGPFVMQEHPTAAHILAWIDTIAAFPRKLRELTQSMDNAQLDRSYRPNGWSAREVIHHCADSHANAYIRLKMALTEEHPIIKPYFEDRWARLPDSQLPIEVSLDLLDALHTRWTELMRSLTPADWTRAFFHPEKDRLVPLLEFLASYAWHCEHHLAHVRIVAEEA